MLIYCTAIENKYHLHSWTHYSITHNWVFALWNQRTLFYFSLRQINMKVIKICLLKEILDGAEVFSLLTMGPWHPASQIQSLTSSHSSCLASCFLSISPGPSVFNHKIGIIIRWLGGWNDITLLKHLIHSLVNSDHSISVICTRDLCLGGLMNE